MNQFVASLWGDEAFAAVLAQKPYWQIILKVAHDTSPPLFYLSLHTWMKLFGTNEIAIRAHSFLYFILTSWVVYLIGKFLFNQKTGTIAALLTFLNPFLFQYGFEGRMYSILAFTVTLSMYFFLTKRRLPYILATTAALYSHHFAIFIVFVQFLLLLPDFKKDFYKTIKPFLIIGLLYLPWLYPLYYQSSLVASGFWLGKPNLSSLYNLIKSFLSGTFRHQLQAKILFLSACLLLLRRWRKNDLVLLVWFFFPILATFIISQVKQSIFFDRYLLFTIPALILLLSSQSRKLAYCFIILLVFVLTSTDWYYFNHPIKKPFRELANFVKGIKREDDFLINWSGGAHHLFESRYYGLRAPLYYPAGKPPFYIGTALMEDEDVIKKLPQKRRIGVITSDSPDLINLPFYKLEKIYAFDGLKLIWFTRKP